MSAPLILPDGTQEWYQCYRWHRDNDLPAVIYPNGSRLWYNRGKLHRDGDNPAVINADGTQMWYQNGKLHRVGLPSVILSNGNQKWHRNGYTMSQWEILESKKRRLNTRYHALNCISNAHGSSGQKLPYLPDGVKDNILQFAGELAL